jgi:superfamily II DNA helicase RecQ
MFFKNIKTLAEVYSYVSHHVLDKCEVAMFHKSTPDSQKDAILRDMSSTFGGIKVVLCSSSFSLGLNLCNVLLCIMYGPPDSPETLLQQTGRVARSQYQSGHGIVLSYKGMGKVSQSMKPFMAGDTCMRSCLLEYLGETVTQDNECCGICHPHVVNPIQQFLPISAASIQSTPDSVQSSISTAFSAMSIEEYWD